VRRETVKERKRYQVVKLSGCQVAKPDRKAPSAAAPYPRRSSHGIEILPWRDLLCQLWAGEINW